MVYLPRHDLHKKKKSYTGIIIIIILCIFFGVGAYKFKEILIIFSSDGRNKINRLEKKITDEFAQNKLTDDLVKDFAKASQSYLNIDMKNPDAFYFLAISGFYESLLTDSEISNSQILMSCLQGQMNLIESKSHFIALQKMYKEAKKARGFGLNSDNLESNNFLILYYEIFYSSKRKEILSREFSMIQPDKISQNLLPIYKKLGLSTACVAGDFPLLEKQLEKYSSLGIDLLAQEDIYFIKGATNYNSNEFVKALEILRKGDFSKNPKLLKEAKILEAMIFFKQNLHEKSLSILEKEYEISEKKDLEILKKIQKVVSSKKGLKSKFVVE